MMKVLLCTLAADYAAFDRLESRIRVVAPTGSIQIRRGIEEISRELRQSLGRYKIAILVAKTSQELEEYIVFKRFLNDFPNILILPDLESHTLLEGHKLHPRFISHIESDFTDVAAVLERILANMHSKYYSENEEKMSRLL